MPVDVPKPSGINYAIYMGETRAQLLYRFGGKMPEGWDWEAAYAAGVIKEYLPDDPTKVDKRTIRDLSVINGPAIVDGPAGTVDYIKVVRPVGERVEVTAGRTNSANGTMADNGAIISCNGEIATTFGSDAYAKIVFSSVGENQVKVELRVGGALAVQRN